jgi:two-component system response regulator ParR
MAKILLIAGDLTQSDRMAAFLAQHDFDPAQVSRGDLAVQAFRRHCAEIVVLDASPPGRDGLKVCRDLRALSAVPILMLSDIRNGQAQVQALDAGADDYVVRPVSPHVLLARIRALLRRRNRSPLAPHRLAFGELVIDCEQRLAWQRGAEVALTTMEFEVLWALASEAGRVLSRQALMLRLRGISNSEQRSNIDAWVSRLRRKLEADWHASSRIKTIRGEGYLFVPEIEGG